jgi:thioredoxin 1
MYIGYNPSIIKREKEMSTSIELTDKNYTAFIEKTDAVVFIDFYSNSCAPCQTLLAFLPNIAEHYKDEEVVIAKVNAPLNPKLSKKFMLQSVPLTVIIGKDKMVKHAEVGLLSIDGYIKMIDKELGKNKGFFSKFFG